MRLIADKDRANKDLLMVKSSLYQRDEQIDDLKSKLKLANYTSAGLTGACLLVLLVAVI